MSNVIVIGAGFAGLSAAAYLARLGHNVSVFEKNSSVGGRARQFSFNDFRFDMGPTFYWMPDVFTKFFADFHKQPSDFYSLSRLDPGYSIVFDNDFSIRQSANFETLADTFDSIEPGSSNFLRSFIHNAGLNYRFAMQHAVYLPGRSPFELCSPQIARRIPQLISSLASVVDRNINDPRLRLMLEFPVLFLGAKPSLTPAFYNFMNYADIVLGSWHVHGGMINVARAIARIAHSLGVQIFCSSPVQRIVTNGRKASGIIANDTFYPADAVVAAADYHHSESLLEPHFRNYRQSYWESRVMAPSAILFYIGFGKKLRRVTHHTLFFDADFDNHATLIYDNPDWPLRPLFYASFPSITDPSLAPDGKETAIILIPSAAGLPESPAVTQHYFRQIISRLEAFTGQSLADAVEYSTSYSINDFIGDYNAFKGNAYGLANTLWQTAFMKPKMFNRQLPNLFYAGQLTVPGPGVPTALISGKIAACALNDSLDRLGSPRHFRMPRRAPLNHCS